MVAKWLFELLQQRHTAGFDYLFATDQAYAFAGFRFNTNLVGFEPGDFSNPLLKHFLVGAELWTLSMDNNVEIANSPTGGGDFVQGQTKHFARVPGTVRLVGVGEHLADVAQCGSAQHCIGNCVQHNVGIAMAHRMAAVRHVDAG